MENHYNKALLLLAGTCVFSLLALYLPPHSGIQKNGLVMPFIHSRRQLPIFSDPKTVELVSREATAEEIMKPQLALPNILFLGAQKAGSSSLANWLFEGGICHAKSFPGEPSYFAKEAHFFDKDDRFGQGVKFYARRFQHCLESGNTEFIMDATPDYLTYPERIFEFYFKIEADALSKLKLMVVLREPISRELSLCNHKIANRGPMTFKQHANGVLRGEPNSRWASTGKYVDHIKKFLSFIRREQLLVLSYDELKTNPRKTQWRIQQFLGKEIPGELATLNKVDNPNKLNEISLVSRQMLEPFFKDKNEELYEFLEAHPGPWMEQRPFPRFLAEL